MYEVKMIALLFLRCLLRFTVFRMGSNMDAAGGFDDIVLYYELDNRKGCDFFQLKHKMVVWKYRVSPITLLLTKKYNLILYFESFQSIQRNHKGNEDLNDLGNFDDFTFILFTNAEEENMMSKNVVQDKDLLADTGGKAFCLGNDEEFRDKFMDVVNEQNKKKREEMLKKKHQITNKNVLNETYEVNDLNKDIEAFLKRTHIYTNQKSEGELESLVKTEIRNIFSATEKNLISIYRELIAEVTTWWSNYSYYLDQTTPFWLEIAKNHVRTLSKKMVSKMNNTSIEYKDSSVDAFKQKLDGTLSGRVINVVVQDDNTILSSIKVHSALKKDNTLSMFVASTTLKESGGENKEEVFSAWKSSWCKTLTVDVVHDNQSDLSDMYRELNNILNRTTNKRLILITLQSVSFQFDVGVCVVEDTFIKEELTPETHARILSKSIKLQGYDVPLFDMVCDDKLMSHMATLGNGEVCFGKPLAKPVEYYLPRKLRVDHNSEIRTSSVEDIRDQVVLLVAEPGMGKTTLLTHVAYTMKKKTPSMWVICVDLADCSRYFDKLIVENINDEEVINVLMIHGTSTESKLERSFFMKKLKGGKMVVLIDGVDEVCPNYESQILLLIKCLMKTKVQQIWITTRELMQKKLEDTIETKACSFVPLNEVDQRKLLMDYWKAENQDMELDNDLVEKFVTGLLQLTGRLNEEKQLNIGTPQMTVMLVVAFKHEIKTYCSTKDWNFGESLDLLRLYESCVDQKFNTYVEEKKKEDVKRAANMSDNRLLKSTMIFNHKLAALKLLLTEKEFDDLNIEEDAKRRLEQFMLNIKSGEEKMGIIDAIKEDKPHFVHRTYAEYFVGRWLAQNFETHKKFVNDKLLQPNFKVIREMFDRSLAYNFETFPLHTAILNRNQILVNRLISDGCSIDLKDKGGTTGLHLAVTYSGLESHTTYLNITRILLESGAKCDVQDKVFGWNALQYADNIEAFTAAGMILQKAVNVPSLMNDVVLVVTQEKFPREIYHEFINYLKTGGNNTTKLMHRVASRGVMKLIRYLVEERGVAVNLPDEDLSIPTHKAAAGAHNDVLKYLITKGGSLNTRDNQGNLPLHYAVQQEIITTVEILVKVNDQLNIDELNSNEETPLSLAARVGDRMFNIVEFLISLKANINSTDKMGRTPLHYAIINGGYKITQCLVNADAEINIQDREGKSSLHLAATHQERDGVEFLSKKESDVKKPDKRVQTSFHLTAKPQGLETVAFLMENGLKMNTLDGHGLTSLPVASKYQNHKTIEYLLNAGANTGLVDNKGRSAIHLATIHQKLETILLLRDWGADVNLSDNCGRTLIHLAVKHQNCVSVKELINIVRDSNVPDVDLRTPLHYAAMYKKDKDVLGCLMDKRTDVNAKDKNDQTALHLAAEQKTSENVRFLATHHADINTADVRGQTPFHLATIHQDMETVRFLITSGANVNMINAIGQTALHMAVKCRGTDIVECLLSEGVDPSVKDKDQRTALHLAAISQLQVPKTLEILKGYGADITERDINGQSPLHLATMRHGEHMMKHLMSESVNNLTDKKGQTALHLAAIHQTPETLKLLISCSLDINQQDNNGRTALHLAVTNQRSNIAKILLTKSAKIDILDNEGKSPVDILVNDVWVKPNEKNELYDWIKTRYIDLNLVDDIRPMQDHEEACYQPLHKATYDGNINKVKELVNNGRCVDEVDRDLNTALLIACKRGDEKMVKTLMTLGSKMQSGAHNQSPLHLAAEFGHLDIVDLLLGYGADINAKDADQATALLRATETEMYKVVLRLLDGGATMAATKYKYTPLHVAAEKDNVALVKLLVERGADKEAKNIYEQSPLSLAVQCNNVEVIDCLIKMGAQINLENSNQKTPLNEAILNNNTIINSYLNKTKPKIKINDMFIPTTSRQK